MENLLGQAAPLSICLLTKNSFEENALADLQAAL